MIAKSGRWTPATAEHRGWCPHQPQYGERNFIFRQSLSFENNNFVPKNQESFSTSYWFWFPKTSCFM